MEPPLTDQEQLWPDSTRRQTPVNQSGRSFLVEQQAQTRSALVGRNAEIARLDGFLRRLPIGTSALAITGDAGIGKSTLWKHAIQQARNQSYAVLVANPAESERSLPFAGLSDLMQTVPNDVYQRLPVPQRDAIRIALVQQTPPVEPIQRHTIARATLSLLRVMAESNPVLVAVDDLQWLDAPTSQVLSFIGRRLEGEPVGILIAVRHDDSDLTPLGSSFDRMQLGPLEIEALDELIAVHLGASLTKSQLRELHLTSGGNPFFALEIARYLLSQHKARRFGDKLPVPSNLRQVVRRRLSRLPAATRDVLLIVATLSQPKESDVVAAMEPGTGRSAVDHAIGTRLLERLGDRLRFTHPLVGSVIYGDAPAEPARILNLKLASIVDSADERVRLLALRSADSDAAVAEELELAARRALVRGAPEIAADLMQRASELTPAQLCDLRQTRVIKAADLLLRVGETARAESLLRPLVGESSSRQMRAQALQRLGMVAWWTEGVDAAEILLRSGIAECRGAQPLSAAISRDLVWVLLQRGDLREAERLAEEMVAAAERSGDPRLIGTGQVLLITARCLLGKGVQPAKARSARALLDSSDPDMDSQIHYTDPLLYLGCVLRWIDDFKSSRDVLRHHLEQMSDLQEESGIGPVLFHLAELECWAGNWDKASEYEEQQRRAERHSGQPMAEFASLTIRAQLHALRGDEGNARSFAEEALKRTEQFGDTRFLMRVLAILGFIELSRGDAGACLRHLSRLRALWDQLHYAEPGMIRFQADEIEALVALGKLDEAAERTRMLGRQGELLDRPWAISTAGRCRALLLAARGDLRAALDSADRAVDAHRRLDQPMELARTLLVQGSIHRRLKERGAARETLERALRLFDQLHAARWSERTRNELTRIGGRQRSSGELSSTERAVADLAAAGATNREIGARLFMSLKTVESNLSKVYRKVGLRSRTQLAASKAALESKK